MPKKSSASVQRAAYAATFAYALLAVASCGVLCMILLIPGSLFLLFGTGSQDSATARVVRGYANKWRAETWTAPITATAAKIVSHDSPRVTVSPSTVSNLNGGAAEAVRGDEHAYEQTAPAPEDREEPTPPNTSSSESWRDVDEDFKESVDMPSVVCNNTRPHSADGFDPSLNQSLAAYAAKQEAPDALQVYLDSMVASSDATTSWLMDVEVERTPVEWQAEYLRLHTGSEDINFQSSGHVSAWSGDFMKQGAELQLL